VDRPATLRADPTLGSDKSLTKCSAMTEQLQTALTSVGAASAELASCRTLWQRRLGLHSPRRAKLMIRAAMVCLAELSSCKFSASHTLPNAADMAVISCASNTLSRKLPSGKNGMIEAIFVDPALFLVPERRNAFSRL
jgi:hypothetical protein